MEERAMGMRYRGSLLHRLDRSRFVIANHHGDEADIIADKLREPGEIQPSLMVDRREVYAVSLAYKILSRLDGCRMLDRGKHYPVPAAPLIDQVAEDSEYGIVALSRTRGEVDALRRRIHQPRHHPPGPVDSRRGITAKGMHARGISI